LPVILYNFENLSLISPLANILILPIIPLTMFLGFGLVILQFVFPPLAVVLAWLAFLPLKYETIIIQFLAGRKYASVALENFPWHGVLIWYIIIGAILFFLKNVQKKNNL
jgi:competence protein ComEC